MRYWDENAFGTNTPEGSQNKGSISLKKGERISLAKKAPKLKTAQVGLGWSCPERVNGYKVDLDATAFLYHSDGMSHGIEDFVFYAHPSAYDDAIKSSGDSFGGGDGNSDDEILYIDFDRIPADIKGVAICVSIYEYRKRRHNFGIVQSAYVRVVNTETGDEEIRYDLSNDFTTETGLIVCKFIRGADGWEMEASGSGIDGGLAGIGGKFGIQLDDENN